MVVFRGIVFLILATFVFSTPGYSTQQQPPFEIHRFVAPGLSYEANAFWVETKTGLILIDGLMLKRDAAQLVAAMKTVNKPLAGIVLTHPHLDHFGGIRTIVEAYGGKVPVYATKPTANAVKKVHDAALATWAKGLGDLYEHNVFVPDHILGSGDDLELAGIRLKLHDYGVMESDDNTVIEIVGAGTIFTGDATVNHATYYVGEGHSTVALQQLKKLAKDFPANTTVYSGHNEAGSLGFVVQQNIEQIEFMRDMVTKAMSDPKNLGADGKLNDKARAETAAAIAQHFEHQGLGSYGLGQIVIAHLNIPGIEGEIVAARSATK